MFTQRDMATGQLIRKLNNLGSGGSGGTAGVNVIDYDPALHKSTISLTTSDVVGNSSATLDLVTDEMQVSAPFGTSVLTMNNTPATQLAYVQMSIPDLGSFTIDASQCGDLWGFVGLPSDIPLLTYLGGVHFVDSSGTNVPNYSFAGISSWQQAEEEYFLRVAAFTVNGGNADKTLTNLSSTASSVKHQDSYTFHVSTIFDFYVAQGYSEAQLVAMLSEEQLNQAKLAKTIYLDGELSYRADLDIAADQLFFFMTPYINVSDPQSTYMLNASSKLTLNFNLTQTLQTIPDDVASGSYLKILKGCKLLGKTFSKNDFALLYDEKTDCIKLKQGV